MCVIMLSMPFTKVNKRNMYNSRFASKYTRDIPNFSDCVLSIPLVHSVTSLVNQTARLLVH